MFVHHFDISNISNKNLTKAAAFFRSKIQTQTISSCRSFVKLLRASQVPKDWVAVQNSCMAWLLSNQTLGFLFQPLEIWRIWNWPLGLTSSNISATKQRTQWHWCCGALSPKARMVCQTSVKLPETLPNRNPQAPRFPDWINGVHDCRGILFGKLRILSTDGTNDPVPIFKKNTQMTTKGEIHTDSMENNTPNRTTLGPLALLKLSSTLAFHENSYVYVCIKISF